MKIRITEEHLRFLVEDKKKTKKKGKKSKKDQKNGKKDDFDRLEYYLEYYENLSPSDFKISEKDGKITIEISKT